MNYRKRLVALEAAARKRPTKCGTCGRGIKNTPDIIVIRKGEELGRCPACEGCLSPSGEPVGVAVNGRLDVTIVCLLLGSGIVIEPPTCGPTS